MAEGLSLPGFVNAHSHAFQRALRGRTEGDDFWGWRDAMMALAAEVTVEQVRAGYVDVYREMLGAGYTAVGEFHYLGLAEAHAAVEAATEAGIELVLLLSAYGRGGIERFRQASVAEYLSQLEAVRETGARVGLAPHSVRACPRDWLEELGRCAAAARARRRAATRDRGVPGRARRPAGRAARGHRLPGAAHDRRARDPCRRSRARPAGRRERARLCLPDHGGEPRRRLRAGASALRARSRHVHWVGLERADRPARGAARTGGDCKTEHRETQRRGALEPPLLRLRRGRRRTRGRALGRRRRRPRTHLACGRRGAGHPRSARVRLLCGRLPLS